MDKWRMWIRHANRRNQMKIDIDWSQLKTPLTGRFRPFDAIRSGRSPPPGNHISKSQKANDSSCLPILCQPDYEKQMKLVSGNTTKYLMVIIPEIWLPINILLHPITKYFSRTVVLASSLLNRLTCLLGVLCRRQLWSVAEAACRRGVEGWHLWWKKRIRNYPLVI